MSQRLLVLFVPLLWLSLWPPPIQTNAQAACPEGGCTIFLPAVSTPSYVAATVDMFDGPPLGCPQRFARVTFTNISTVPVSTIVSKGEIYSERDVYDPEDPGNGTTVRVVTPFAFTSEDTLLPGKTFSYPVRIDDCVHFYQGARIDVYGATPVENVAEIVVDSKQLEFRVKDSMSGGPRPTALYRSVAPILVLRPLLASV